MKIRTTQLLAAGAVLVLTAGAASAATITWTSSAFVNEGGAVKGTMGTGQFDTSGTQLVADNLGGAAGTYDGITYTTGVISNFAGGAVDNTFHEAAMLVSAAATYGSSGADTVTLGAGGDGPALDIGTQYRVQLFLMDGRGTAGITGRTAEVDGVNQGTYANGTTNVTWGDGLLVTGTFTADATSQSFTVETFDGSTSKGGQLNALLLHEVPEPGSLALLGLGGLMMIRRRRG